MRFRPYPGFTIATVILLAILCGLGFWQIQRLHWKLVLIDRVARNMHARPLPLGDDGGVPYQEIYTEYEHVRVHGRFDNAKEAYVFTTDAEGNPVYHVITPFLTPDRHAYLVDRGMVTKDRLDPATRRAGLINGDTHVTGFWRTPDPPGAFTPAPDLAHRIWYARDVEAIARADGIRLPAATIIEADAAPNPGGWPKGGQTVVAFRNEHLSYAITWFGLAAGLLGVWVAYHISRGRLAFK